jgi:hypothetical protein
VLTANQVLACKLFETVLGIANNELYGLDCDRGDFKQLLGLLHYFDSGCPQEFTVLCEIDEYTRGKYTQRCESRENSTTCGFTFTDITNTFACDPLTFTDVSADDSVALTPPLQP